MTPSRMLNRDYWNASGPALIFLSTNAGEEFFADVFHCVELSRCYLTLKTFENTDDAAEIGA